MSILPTPKYNNECKNFRIMSEPGEKGIRASDSRLSWLGKSIKYQGEDGKDQYLNYQSAINYVRRKSNALNLGEGSNLNDQISGKNILCCLEHLHQISFLPAHLRDVKTYKVLDISVKSKKRSTAEKILRGITAPVTAPMMAVGGALLAIGRVGVCGPLGIGARIGAKIFHAIGGFDKKDSIIEIIGKVMLLAALVLFGTVAAGIVASPIIITSAAIGLIGTGLFFCGGSILAPDFTKKTINDYTPFGSHDLKETLFIGIVGLGLFIPKKQK